ncbi:V-type ATPase subunit [Vagococcus fluvialis]|jgi:V/A-type H+-transporting ATPase subunit C|uniref:V-type ATP synthase subunit C n=1 Tax=Vagococcus fluvialis bH819 TaxID=1255619 RepID=A0A1X6WRR7_9ENTE|nr:V-type ATPase subunit [Vagococcus fluvialis]SLM87051.1 V-type ATP synthase subunit C [Vagococcus fluvialis bH819]
MKDMLYNQINTMVRMEESYLLKSEHLNKMLLSDSFDEAKELLRNTKYDSYIDESDFLMNFDYYLRKEQHRLFKKMYEVAPEKEVIDIYTMRYTYHNLKLITKAYYSHQQLDQYFIDDGQYSLATIKSAVKNGTSTSIKGLLMDSILDVKAYLEEYQDVRGIDVIYDRYYLRHQRQAANKLDYPELSKEVIAFIDLTNISMVFRGIKQKRTPTFLLTTLSSFGSFDKKQLASFANQTASDFTSFLSGSDYHEVTSSLVNKETDEINLLLLAKERDNFLTKIYNLANTQAFGPLPLLSLLNAKDIEIKNIQLILAGKKNNFSEKAIRERIRENNEL